MHVTGQVTIPISELGPDQPADMSGFLVVLSLPVAIDGDLNQQSKGYWYYNYTNAAGRFIIDHVMPDTYEIHIWRNGTLGNYTHPCLINAVNQSQYTFDAGLITWIPLRYGPTMWEIGRPDWDSREFTNAINANTYGVYHYYPIFFPNGTHYFIDMTASREAQIEQWATQWYFEQVPVAPNSAYPYWNTGAVDVPWFAYFNTTISPSSISAVMLRIGFAGIVSCGLIVDMNGVQISSWLDLKSQSDNSIYRDSSFGQYNYKQVNVSSSLLAPLGEQNTITLMTQCSGSGTGMEYDYLRMEAIYPDNRQASPAQPTTCSVTATPPQSSVESSSSTGGAAYAASSSSAVPSAASSSSVAPTAATSSAAAPTAVSSSAAVPTAASSASAIPTAASSSSAAPPAGPVGSVTFYTDATYAYLSNGLFTLQMILSTGLHKSWKAPQLAGDVDFLATNGQAQWDTNTGSLDYYPANMNFNVLVNTSELVHVSLTEPTPNATNGHPNFPYFVWEFHYVMVANVTGYYTWAVVTRDEVVYPGVPDYDIVDFRYVIRMNHGTAAANYSDAPFDRVRISDWRQTDRLQPTYLGSMEGLSRPLPGAPKEVELCPMPDGTTQLIHKYDTCLSSIDRKVFGWYNSSSSLGIWAIIPDYSYVNGNWYNQEISAYGPTNLTSALFAILQSTEGEHYGSREQPVSLQVPARPRTERYTDRSWYMSTMAATRMRHGTTPWRSTRSSMRRGRTRSSTRRTTRSRTECT